MPEAGRKYQLQLVAVNVDPVGRVLTESTVAATGVKVVPGERQPEPRVNASTGRGFLADYSFRVDPSPRPPLDLRRPVDRETHAALLVAALVYFGGLVLALRRR